MPTTDTVRGVLFGIRTSWKSSDYDYRAFLNTGESTITVVWDNAVHAACSRDLTDGQLRILVGNWETIRSEFVFHVTGVRPIVPVTALLS